MHKVRVAIAGVGRAAKVIHIPALRKLSGVEIVGVYDLRQGPSELPSFATLEALLETKPDVVLIATPPDSHLEIALAALAAGAHVFCEKPLANSVEEADAIAAAANTAGRQVCVNSEFPFMPMHLAAAREIGSERFGRLLFVEAHQTFVVTPETEAGWRGADPQRTFKEFGTHVIDLCKAFFGERPIGMSARMPRPLSNGGPDYLNLVRLEFSGDRVAQITLDRLTKGKHRYLDLRLVGEKGTIETSLGGSAEVRLGLRPKGRTPFAEWSIHLGGVARLYHGERFTTLARAPLDLYPDATARLYRAFFDAIAAGREPPNSIAEARDTLALLYRAYAEAEAKWS
ncbi:MAG: Gfo/Idh/MocA family oxidoreductase [Sphingomicrobium sp.]